VAHRARQRARDGPTTRGRVGELEPDVATTEGRAAPFTLTTLSLIVAFPPANDLPFHETVSFTGRSSRPEARCSHGSRRTCR